MKVCNTCRKPLNQDEYSERKQSIFRSTSCKSCHGLTKQKREEIKKMKREECLDRVRKVCATKPVTAIINQEKGNK